MYVISVLYFIACSNIIIYTAVYIREGKYLKGDEKCEIINEHYRTEVSIIPTAFINPRRMHRRVIVVVWFVVCLSVCYH